MSQRKTSPVQVGTYRTKVDNMLVEKPGILSIGKFVRTARCVVSFDLW